VYNDKSTRTYGQIMTVKDAFSIPQRHRRPGPTLGMAAAKRTLEPRRLAGMIVLPEDLEHRAGEALEYENRHDHSRRQDSLWWQVSDVSDLPSS